MWFPRRSGLAVLILALLAGPASSAALTVLSPASAAPGLKALAAQYTAKTGQPVTLGGNGRQAVLAALKIGPADVVVLPTTDFVNLSSVHGMTPLGHILVGVGVKAGAKVPDISTPEKFRSALLAAKGVAYADPSAGTSAGKVIDRRLSGPDFAGVKRVPVQGLAVTALASGQADIALQMLPELMTNKDVALAGAVPELYGAAVDFSAGIAGVSNDAINAGAFISFVTAPAQAPLWKGHGVILLGTP